MHDLLNFICCSAFVIFKLRFSIVRNNILTSDEANLKITNDNQKDKEKSIMNTILLNVSNFNRVHNHEVSVKNDDRIKSEIHKEIIGTQKQTSKRTRNPTKGDGRVSENNDIGYRLNKTIVRTRNP